MHFLITGGAGFIGSHLTESLLNHGHVVTIIDNLSTGHPANIAKFQDHPNFRFVQDDVTTSPLLPNLIDEAEAIFHLAAIVGVELVLQEPLKTLQTNLHATERLLELTAPQKKSIIIASTSEVYGISDNPSFCETDSLRIGAPTKSRWNYAASKLIDECLALTYARTCNAPICVVRFFNIVGPGQIGTYGMVLPRMIQKAQAQRPIQVYGSGEQCRCFCHVNDAVRALQQLIGHPNSQGEIFNIGSTESVSINELAQRVIRLTSSSAEIQHIPYEQAYDSQGFEEMYHRTPNIEKIQKLLNWAPTYCLDDIICDIINKNNEISTI